MPYQSETSKEKHPRIVVSKFGDVKGEETESVVKVMGECYDRLTPHAVALVDLYVFERSSSVDAFTAKESEEVGVVSAPFDELFFAMHDTGRLFIPRLFFRHQGLFRQETWKIQTGLSLRCKLGLNVDFLRSYRSSLVAN